MRTIHLGAAMVVALGSTAHAGGFERSDQSVGILFKEGTYAEIATRAGFPDVTGVGALQTPGVETGDIAENFVDFYGAIKFDIDDTFSAALIYEEPFGTDIKYPNSNYFASLSQGELKSREIAGILQYNTPKSMAVLGGNFSAYGGPRISRLNASASLRATGAPTYDIETDPAIGFGFVAGVAWERPELGMRASLTYNSEIRHTLDSVETFGPGVPFSGTVAGETDVNTPRSVTFEFQTGLNPKTLLFGSVRWVPWDNFEINPPSFETRTTNALVSFPSHSTTFRLGVGRKITENFSIFGDTAYEPQSGESYGNLTPRDGFVSFAAGGTYDFGKVDLTLGARYAFLGDADTVRDTAAADIDPAGRFDDNSVLFFGAKLGFDLN